MSHAQTEISLSSTGLQPLLGQCICGRKPNSLTYHRHGLAKETHNSDISALFRLLAMKHSRPILLDAYKTIAVTCEDHRRVLDKLNPSGCEWTPLRWVFRCDLTLGKTAKYAKVNRCNCSKKIETKGISVHHVLFSITTFFSFCFIFLQVKLLPEHPLSTPFQQAVQCKTRLKWTLPRSVTV